MGAGWPAWRGPERNGHVAAGVAVPTTLPASPKVLWHIKVGNGLASPVVSAGRLFYIDNQEKKETVHCIDAATATEHWRAMLDDEFQDGQSVAGPRAPPPPTAIACMCSRAGASFSALARPMAR